MTTQEIYNLAKELTEKEVNNVLASWKTANELEAIRTFNSLVSLGDSRELALATTIAKKYNSVTDFQFYFNAYNI